MRDELYTLLAAIDFSSIATVKVHKAEEQTAGEYRVMIAEELLQSNDAIGMYMRNYRVRVVIVGSTYTKIKQIFDKIQDALTTNSLEWQITYTSKYHGAFVCTISRSTLEAYT